MAKRIIKTEPGNRERYLEEGRERDAGIAESRSVEDGFYDEVRDRENGFSGYENNFGDFGALDLSLSSLWSKFLSLNSGIKLGLIAAVLAGTYFVIDEIDRRKRFFG